MDEEAKKLTEEIMSGFHDEAKHEAFQTFIILQQASDDDLKIINKVLSKTILLKNLDAMPPVSLVRGFDLGLRTTGIIKMVEFLQTSETSKADIIHKALSFMVLSSQFSKEDQDKIITISKKYTNHQQPKEAKQ